MKASLSILFAEDKALYRKTILRELEDYHINCIGEAENGRELMRHLKSKKPDVILLDLEMPVMNGNETMCKIMETYPEARVIIMSLHNEEELVEDYIRRGAKGYVSKDVICGNIELLVEAIQLAAAGQVFKQAVGHTERKKFTNRQMELIPLICDELTNKQIADKLGILERSVEKQRQKIYTRSNATGSTSFLKYAFKKGLDFLERKKKN